MNNISTNKRIRDGVRRGFTLIELLLVITVIALLTSLFLSNLIGAREGARISNALQFEFSMHSVLGGDLAGHWNFNDPLNRYKDLAGGGNSVSCTSCPTPVGGVPGSLGTAMLFNGDGNAMQTPSSEHFDFRGKSVTVSSWINPDFSSFGRIVNQYATLSMDTSGAFIHTDGGSIEASWAGCGGLANGTWSHLVITFNRDFSRLNIYKDGEVCDEDTGSGQIERYYGNIWIGSGSADWNQTYKGIIDDVRVYSRALTGQEILNLYARTKGNYLVEQN